MMEGAYWTGVVYHLTLAAAAGFAGWEAYRVRQWERRRSASSAAWVGHWRTDAGLALAFALLASVPVWAAAGWSGEVFRFAVLLVFTGLGMQRLQESRSMRQAQAQHQEQGQEHDAVSHGHI